MRISLLLLITTAAILPTRGQVCNKETLKYFQDSIKFHTNVTKELTYLACNDEFVKYRTCCESEGLQDFIEKVVESDSLRWNNAIRNAWVFMKEVVANRGGIKDKLSAMLPELKKAVIEKKIDRVAVDAAEMVLKALPALEPETFAERLDQFKKGAQGCFDEVTTLRKNSMCLICSGRSGTFFDGKVMNIKQKTCSDILTTCLRTYSFTFTIMGTLRGLFDLVNSLEKREVYPKAVDELPYSSRIY